MATNEIKYSLNVQLADNTVTVDNKDDKIAVLVPAGTADFQRVVSEIMEVNPGLERETVEAVMNLENRVVKKLLLTGFRVNTGLYNAVAQPTGVVENKAWDKSKNSLYISFTQGADLREAISATTVNIIGEKGDSMYIAGGLDAATRASGFTATAGRNFTLTGSHIKVAGTDPSVGITLTASAGGAVTQITEDMWAVNEPSKLIFLIPAGLPDGEYTLRVTTQYNSGNKTLLKNPRSVEQTIYIGQAPAGGSTDGGGTTPGGDTGSGDDDNAGL